MQIVVQIKYWLPGAIEKCLHEQVRLEVARDRNDGPRLRDTERSSHRHADGGPVCYIDRPECESGGECCGYRTLNRINIRDGRRSGPPGHPVREVGLPRIER